MTLSCRLTVLRLNFAVLYWFSSGRAVAHTTDADARRYEITGLSAGVTYVIRIAAVNINGTGEFTSWAEKATYTQELDGMYIGM